MSLCENSILRKQILTKTLIFVGIVLTLLFSTSQTMGAPLSQSNAVSVEMYELEQSGANTGEECYEGNVNYGCTFITNNPNYAYPYGNDSSPSVAMETDYLLDVVAQEMSPELYGEATALEAQAVVSRSFANYYINNPPTVEFNNSTQYQAFIPYRFEGLNSDESPNDVNHCASTLLNGDQQKVCAAVASGDYIASASPSGNQFAAKALFTADIKDDTDDGTFDKPYLASVLEPISVACDAVDEGENQYGMSQKGANRWARGHQCSRPRDDNFEGDPWSVKWTRSEQILFHYYTGVHLRDQSGNRLSPEYRWNPLAMTGLPEVLYPSQSVDIAIQCKTHPYMTGAVMPRRQVCLYLCLLFSITSCIYA